MEEFILLVIICLSGFGVKRWFFVEGVSVVDLDSIFESIVF